MSDERRTAAVESGPQGSSGTVFDIGYQRYTGVREGRSRGRRALFRDGVRTALALGRDVRAKALPWSFIVLLVGLGFVLALGAGAALRTLGPEVADQLPSHADYYGITSLIFVLFAAVTAPELLCPDRRNRVVDLYFVRPITPLDYILSRWAAFLAVALAVAWVPQIVLMIGLVMGNPEPIAYLQENWTNLPKILVAGGAVAVYATTLALAVASFTTRRAYAAAFLVGLFVISAPFTIGLAEESEGAVGQWVAMFNLGAIPVHVNDIVLRRGHGHGGDRRRAPPACRGTDRVVRGVGDRAGRGAPLPLPEERAVTEPVIRVDRVSRWFGDVVAVSDVSFEILPGITGILGPNGAGKTTLLRMMTGLAEVSDGSISMFGEPVRDNPPLYGRIGVMSEHETVYGRMTGRAFVRTMARLRKVADPDEATDRAIDLVDLQSAADLKMGTYSRGMRQRMRLAATLVHDPEILVLDEPLNGADPRQRYHFQELLRRLAADGRTILLSSHILEEVEQLADTVLLVINGKLAASGGFRAIRAALDHRPYHVRVVCHDPRRMASELVSLDCVEAVRLDPDGSIVAESTRVRELQIQLPRIAQDAELRLRGVEPLDDSLESVFGYLVER